VLFNSAPPQDTTELRQVIDAVAPTTVLSATQLAAGGSDFQVSWSATDDAGGSGVKHVTVYVAEDGGDFKIWLRQTADTSASYQGRSGHTYEFLALATDNAGNRERAPFGVQATDDGSGVNLGGRPLVEQTRTDRFSPAIMVGPMPIGNSLFQEALQGIPSQPPASRLAEFQSVVRPFTAQAFATGIPASGAGIGPLAIEVLSDGSVLASGGPTRGQLFHFPADGGQAGSPLADLPYPIFDLQQDPSGRLQLISASAARWK